MNSSQTEKSDIILNLYKEKRTLFRFTDIAMLTGISDFNSLSRRLNYYVRTGKLLNPRKGIYAKEGYDLLELACSVYSPSYISLQYVLQGAGVLFQYDTRITSVSYLNRTIEVDGREYQYRKIKDVALVDFKGIIRRENHVNIATPERAFLDLLYLEKEFWFDNLNPLNIELVKETLPLYRSNALIKRVSKLLGI